MAALEPVDRIEVGDDAGLFLVAGSFEPRSVRATRLLDGNVDRAVVFTYDDTLDTESGRRNTREIEACLREKYRAVDVLHCRVGDPFSVVRAFHTYVTQERLVGAIQAGRGPSPVPPRASHSGGVPSRCPRAGRRSQRRSPRRPPGGTLRWYFISGRSHARGAGGGFADAEEVGRYAWWG